MKCTRPQTAATGGVIPQAKFWPLLRLANSELPEGQKGTSCNKLMVQTGQKFAIGTLKYDKVELD